MQLQGVILIWPCCIDHKFENLIWALEFCKVQKVDTWYGHWLGGVGVHHGVTFNFVTTKVCAPAILQTCFSYDKDIWIAATDYYMYFLHTLV